MLSKNLYNSRPKNGIAVLVAGCFALAWMAVDTHSAQAQQPFGFGFQPYGFYQPYGVQYRSRTPTPPYFALNPPVYYGTRYARPYGISPFAAPPQVQVGQDFRGRAAASPYRAPGYRGPVSNPFICQSGTVAKKSETEKTESTQSEEQVRVAFRAGDIKANPFVSTNRSIDFAQR